VESAVTRIPSRAPFAEPSRPWLLAPLDRRRRRRPARWKALLPGSALVLLALVLAALLAEALAIVMP
jgi:hypothetical protein